MQDTPAWSFLLTLLHTLSAGNGFANLPANPLGMLQHGPLRQKFPYLPVGLGHPTFSSSLMSSKLHPAGTEGGDSLYTTPRGLPWFYLPGGTAGVREGSRPGTRTGLAGGGTARCAVTPIRPPGPQACWLCPGQAPAAPPRHLLCTDPEKLSPSPLTFMAPDAGAPLPEPHGVLYMMQRLFPCIFPAPACLLLTLRGGDGCTASATSAT